MKTLILAGGYGTRIAEYTGSIPKPMIPIGGHPILWHVMGLYARFDHKDFYVAAGYKSQIIKQFFLNFCSLNSNFSINLENGLVKQFDGEKLDWTVTIVDTGQDTMTGGRIRRMREFIGDETFMVTYGDGLANIDISRLIAFHQSHGKIATVTAVRPQARFGELKMDGGLVKKFEEKPQMHDGWINGGFFVFQPEFFDFIRGDETLLEREPLEKLVKAGQLMAYRHDGFWHCMDTKRDHQFLEKMWLEGAQWLVQ